MLRAPPRATEVTGNTEATVGTNLYGTEGVNGATQRVPLRPEQTPGGLAQPGPESLPPEAAGPSLLRSQRQVGRRRLGWCAGAWSGGAFVGADGQGGEDDEDAGQPGDGLPQGGGDRAAEGHGSHRVDGERDGLVVGEGLEPAGHGGDRHEGGAEESDREQPDQAERLHRLLVPDGQAGVGGDQAAGDAEHDGQYDHADGRADAVAEAEADRVADTDHDEDRDGHRAGSAAQPARQHRRPGHRHRPEPVDDPLLQLLGQRDRRAEAGEGRGLAEDARHQEVDVAAGDVDLDRAAEHVAEHQHEHDRLDDGEHDVGRDPGPDQQVPLADGQGVADRPAGPGDQAGGSRRRRNGDGGHDEALSTLSAPLRRPRRRLPPLSFSSSSSAAWPVRARNTSSREGRRSPSPLVPSPASSRLRTDWIRASEPLSPTGTLITPVPSSTCGSPSASLDVAATASPTRVRSGTVNSSTSPPTRPFSSAEVPAAMTSPWSMTTISSASSSASSRYWVVSSSVVPPATSDRMTSQMTSRARGSSPVVGSSRNRTCGFPTRLAARSSRRCMPPENVLAARSAASVRPNCSSSSVARALDAARPRWYSRPMISRFSRPVSSIWMAADWPARPIDRRTALGSFTTSWPSTSARPPSGRSKVVRMRTAVVLPAPLGPSTPRTVPRGTDRSMPRSA